MQSFFFFFLIYYKVSVLRGSWNPIEKEKMNTWRKKRPAQMLHTSGLSTLLQDRALLWNRCVGRDPLEGQPVWPRGGTDWPEWWRLGHHWMWLQSATWPLGSHWPFSSECLPLWFPCTLPRCTSSSLGVQGRRGRANFPVTMLRSNVILSDSSQVP